MNLNISSVANTVVKHFLSLRNSTEFSRLSLVRLSLDYLHHLLTAAELKSALHEDGVSGLVLGADDPALLHDDLGVQTPPGT